MFEIHECPPRWTVLQEDGWGVGGPTEDDWRESSVAVYGESATVAACRYGEDLDRDDATYPLAHGGEIRVLVRSASGEVTAFDVGGRLDPVYYAHIPESF